MAFEVIKFAVKSQTWIVSSGDHKCRLMTVSCQHNRLRWQPVRNTYSAISLLMMTYDKSVVAYRTIEVSLIADSRPYCWCFPGLASYSHSNYLIVCAPGVVAAGGVTSELEL